MTAQSSNFWGFMPMYFTTGFCSILVLKVAEEGSATVLGARFIIQETKMQELEHFGFVGKTNIPTTFHEF